MQDPEPSTPRPRYLFVIPPVRKPTGGVNVILWMVEKLRESGHEALPLLGRRDGALFSRPVAGTPLYSPDLDRVFRRGVMARGVKVRFRQILDHWSTRLQTALGAQKSLAPWRPRAGDILVLPEFMYPEISRAFPGRRQILLVQGYMGLLKSLLRDSADPGRGPRDFQAILSGSRACAEAVRAAFSRPSPTILLPVCKPGLTFNPDKKLQIAYMPRRRATEVRIMERLIQAHPDLADIPLVPIDGVSEEEAQRLIRESLFFLAFSEKEGFGLPPAEAMATGSLVIGYTGVGGAEYFTPETGFPIADGDAVAFLETLVEVVRLWRSTPAALEAKRATASAAMWNTYSEAQAIARLNTLWAEIDASLAPGQAPE